MRKKFVVLFLCLTMVFSVIFSSKYFVFAEENFVDLTSTQVMEYYGLTTISYEYFILVKVKSDTYFIINLVDESTQLSIINYNNKIKFDSNGKNLQYYKVVFKGSTSSSKISGTYISAYSVNGFDFLYTNLPSNVSFVGDIDNEPDYVMMNSLSTPIHVHQWSDIWSTDSDYHWHTCLDSDGLCEIISPADMDSYGAHVYDDDQDPDCNICGFTRSITVLHSHSWSDAWSSDSDYHWHTCINSDGLCDLSVPSVMDSYAVHVYDDDQDPDCNICGFTRTIVPVVPSVSPTPTNTPTPTNMPTPTPTPRPTATPTPTPPPFFPGGPDEDGNWVGYTEFEATALNFLQDIKGLLIDILWWCKNAVAFLFILVGFESMRIVSAWIKGGIKGARSG